MLFSLFLSLKSASVFIQKMQTSVDSSLFGVLTLLNKLFLLVDPSGIRLLYHV